MAKTGIGKPALRREIDVNGSHQLVAGGHSNMIMKVGGDTVKFENVGGTHQVAGALAVLLAIKNADDQGVTHLTITSPSRRINAHDAESWNRDDDFLALLHWNIDRLRAQFDDLEIL